MQKKGLAFLFVLFHEPNIRIIEHSSQLTTLPVKFLPSSVRTQMQWHNEIFLSYLPGDLTVRIAQRAMFARSLESPHSQTGTENVHRSLKCTYSHNITLLAPT